MDSGNAISVVDLRWTVASFFGFSVFDYAAGLPHDLVLVDPLRGSISQPFTCFETC